jgi:hypothetical protein
LRCATGERVKKSYIPNNQCINNSHILQTATVGEIGQTIKRQHFPVPNHWITLLDGYFIPFPDKGSRIHPPFLFFSNTQGFKPIVIENTIRQAPQPDI